VYEQSRHNRPNDARATTAPRLVAFGDPVYPAPARSLALSPLPATRKEVQGIARLFPGTADVFLGAEATEERAKAIGRDAAYVHIASHALLDEHLALNSALVFTIPSEQRPDRANGLLQVWEVFEQVRLDADLVTLSACETGLGMEVSGEGLIGLTRAFQFAGARSVVASLWSVADESTADLMTRFYSELRAGKSKDEALRSAQLGAIRGQTAYSHPFHWAAFQLFGDWK
jgi:CHAT domain-containing protein